MVAIPDRDRLEAVLMLREGLGWAVGVGRLVGGRIERERSGHVAEREAHDAAVALGDCLDMLVLRT